MLIYYKIFFGFSLISCVIASLLFPGNTETMWGLLFTKTFIPLTVIWYVWFAFFHIRNYSLYTSLPLEKGDKNPTGITLHVLCIFCALFFGAFSVGFIATPFVLANQYGPQQGSFVVEGPVKEKITIGEKGYEDYYFVVEGRDEKLWKFRVAKADFDKKNEGDFHQATFAKGTLGLPFPTKRPVPMEDATNFFGVFLLLGIFTSSGLFTWYIMGRARRRAVERARALQAFGSQFGYRQLGSYVFKEEEPGKGLVAVDRESPARGIEDLENSLKKFADYDLFQTGHSKYVFNVLYKQKASLQYYLFVYNYTQGFDKRSRIRSQTVMIFPKVPFQIPWFELKPKGLWEKTKSIFGAKSLAEGMGTQFERRFHISGKQENQIRQMFHSNVVAHFEKEPDICVASLEDSLLIFQPETEIPLNHLEAFAKKGLELVELLGRPGPESVRAV